MSGEALFSTIRYSDRTHANMFEQQVTLIQIKLISGIQVTYWTLDFSLYISSPSEKTRQSIIPFL